MATRVFLLSADEKAVHVITQILDEQDIRFEHSSDPTFTLKRLAGQHFDVLVVDCDNTESAMQVFNSARASHLNKSAIAVAIVEGKAGVPSAFRLGASLVLTKPVSLDQARNTLRTAVGMTKKDAAEVRPIVTPPAAAAVVPPFVPQTPSTSSTPGASNTSPATPVVPRIPVIVPQASPASTANTPTASPVPAPTPAPIVAPVQVAAAPATAKMAEPPAPAKAVEVPAKEPISITPIAPAAPVPASVEAATIDKPLPTLVPKPAPALQLSETRIQKAEPEIEPTKPDHDEVEITPKPALDQKFEAMSLTSAMLESPELKATIDKIESSLAESQPESKFSDNVEMFAPAAKEEKKAESAASSEAMEESAASLRAGAVPAFGGLGKEPFAGIEPTNNRKRGLVIGSIVAMLAAAGFAGAWLYVPGFKNAVSWEYAQLLNRVHPQKSAPVVVVISKPVPPPQPMPATVLPTEATANTITDTPATSASATSAASPVATAPAATAPATTQVAQTSSAPASNGAPAKAPASTVPVPAPATQTKASSPALVNASASNIPAATAKPTDLFEVPEDFADDQVIHRVHPAYPPAARVRKIQGSVVLQAIINKQGKVDSLQLVSGDPLLAQAAADAVKQWRYKPYSHNGEPIEFQTRVSVDFKLP